MTNIKAALDIQTGRIVILNRIISERNALICVLQKERNKAMGFVNGTHAEMDRLTATNKRLQGIVDLYIAGRLA